MLARLRVIRGADEAGFSRIDARCNDGPEHRQTCASKVRDW